MTITRETPVARTRSFHEAGRGGYALPRAASAPVHPGDAMPRPISLMLAVEAALLGGALAVAGPPALTVMAVAIGVAALAGTDGRRLAALSPALLWLVASRLTGRRDLYFPFCMHLAGLLAASAPGTLGAVGQGGAVVAAFLTVRTAQHASRGVLILEAAVAGAILAAAVAMGAVRRARGAGTRADSVIALGAALLALAGLAL